MQPLAAALRVHNMIMSGGLDHALDVLTLDNFTSAVTGFRYLRLYEAANLIESARETASDDTLREEFDARYDSLVPSDQTIGDHFEAVRADHPDDFAPTG
jgi:hypothetical protein